MFPVMDSNGNLTNVVLHWIDVTARKQAEDDLVESRAKLLEAQYIAKIGDFSWEIETGTVSWSDGMHVLLKYDKDEAIDYGRVNREIHHPDDLDMVTKWLLDSIASGVDKLVPREYRLLCKDGDAIWVQTNGRIEYADGKATILFGTCQDISARKRAETEKLTLERQVQHAQKLESLGVLAGGIAHDFNNLLMAILGNSDLALHKLSPMAPARHHIEEIEKATIRAADLAKQMLAYSGKGRFVLEPIQCNELVEEMAHLLKVSISKKAVLKFNPAENLPTFDGDVTQIRQILMNLIINASEAIGEKSGTIALSTGAMHCDLAYLEDVSQTLLGSNDNPLPEGIYIYFEVADTGCGMDDETITNIFDPFFTTKFTGRGLGMSAVLGIVRGHKGAIKVYSEVGRGTTFKILIPANDLSATESGWTEVNEQEGGDWRGSGTVLVVDDEEAICAVGMQMVESMGFSALTAPDGREAVQLFRDNADDIVCVLLDLTMPHMNGEEAFREMRRIKPDAVVILCSGYNEQDATQRFSGKGLAGFIQKPYNLATIKGELMRVLPKSD
ncbi:MAG: response regulator [bacterium]|nr:response regulator [bacterium]